ncbi:MAG: endolytic transglycosylase MltG, partial [Actinomycetota bacterium]
MVTHLDPLLPEAEVDPDARPAIDWPTDPWDDADRTGTVERLRRQTRPLKWVVYASMVVAIAMILIAGAVGWWYLERINPEGDAGAVQSFVIAEGETFEEVSQRLEDNGIISDVGVWEWYVDRNGGLEIIPGFYEVRPDDHMGNVLGRLRTPPAQTYSRVTFPEGFTVAQMSRRLDSEIERMTQNDFVTAANDGDVAALYRPAGITTLEGLLFPDTYQVSNAESEAQVVDRMVGLMERVGSQEEIFSKGQALGRTPYEILIIASMIEKEEKEPEVPATSS